MKGGVKKGIVIYSAAMCYDVLRWKMTLKLLLNNKKIPMGFLRKVSALPSALIQGARGLQ